MVVDEFDTHRVYHTLSKIEGTKRKFFKIFYEDSAGMLGNETAGGNGEYMGAGNVEL